MYTLYTDGSAVPNPGPCGAGAVLLDSNEKIVWTLSEYLGEGTNNVGELTAILRGLQRFSELNLDGEKLEIFSDSELSVELVNGTKTTKKPHLLKILEPILEFKPQKNIYMTEFTISWVKAHADNKWNNYADILATNAVSISCNTFAKINTFEKTSIPTVPTNTLPKISSITEKSRLLLSCSFKEKDKVKALGARWDPESKSWWVEDKPENQETFAKWISS